MEKRKQEKQGYGCVVTATALSQLEKPWKSSQSCLPIGQEGRNLSTTFYPPLFKAAPGTMAPSHIGLHSFTKTFSGSHFEIHSIVSRKRLPCTHSMPSPQDSEVPHSKHCQHNATGDKSGTHHWTSDYGISKLWVTQRQEVLSLIFSPLTLYILYAHRVQRW